MCERASSQTNAVAKDCMTAGFSCVIWLMMDKIELLSDGEKAGMAAEAFQDHSKLGC